MGITFHMLIALWSDLSKYRFQAYGISLTTKIHLIIETGHVRVAMH